MANSGTTLKYPKDSMYKCSECVRHFMGGSALAAYEGHCNFCNMKIDAEADRVK
jgi:DNA-directed RNA polymerase subunit RPC12/RpoP